MSITDVIAVVALVLAATVLALLMVLGLFRLLVRVSGWHDLAARHPAKNPPAGETLRRQTLMVGPVRFRHSATVVVAAEGVYVAVAGGGHGVLIPWAELKPLPRRNARATSGVRMQVAEPRVAVLTVAPALFALIEPHVGPAPLERE